jgi:hypothetical protein
LKVTLEFLKDVRCVDNFEATEDTPFGISIILLSDLGWATSFSLLLEAWVYCVTLLCEKPLLRIVRSIFLHLSRFGSDCTLRVLLSSPSWLSLWVNKVKQQLGLESSYFWYSTVWGVLYAMNSDLELF